MKQRPADGTAGDDGEERGNPGRHQRADYDLERDSHQERQHRAEQNDNCESAIDRWASGSCLDRP